MRWKHMNLTFSTHLKLLKNIIGSIKFKKSKNRQIEKSNLISIENFRKSKIRKSKNSKMCNWNQVTFFDFSIFRFFEFFQNHFQKYIFNFFVFEYFFDRSFLKFRKIDEAWFHHRETPTNAMREHFIGKVTCGSG